MELKIKKLKEEEELITSRLQKKQEMKQKLN